MKYLIRIGASVAIVLATVLSTTGYASAVTGTDFNPGRIIDDVIFTNKVSMSPTQIQLFLQSKVAGGSCDTTGARPSTKWYTAANRYYTHAEWGALNGNPAPFVCLTTYRENPTTTQTNLGNPDVVIAGAQTAAEIIYNAGQQYNINPQALIVLLQKEQSLVTDEWPWLNQFAKATGAYCPDTAPCDATKAGFGTQVREAARLFRYYMDTPFLYFVGNNYVLYNPNTACGGTVINIQNLATVALYHYTPYQPNAAALNNLYGTGDGCSAYGNRNFWRMFNDWFGATLTSAYAYTFVNSSYSNVTLEVGQKQANNFVTIRNNGYATWYADGSAPTGQGAVRLAVKDYINSPFADTSDPAWLGTRNQIKMTPATVAPGQDATFTFSLEGPAPPIQPSQLMTLVPVVDGVGFMPNINMQVLISHTTPLYSVVSAVGIPSQLLPNEQTTASIVLKNTGAGAWYADGAVPVGKNAMRLALKGYQETGYADRTDPAWLGTRNQIIMTPATVAPGQNATFTFKLEGPYVQHFEKLHFVPVLNGVTFLNDVNMFAFVTTPTPVNTYSYVTAINAPASMAKGSIANVGLTLKNTGNTVWRNGTSKAGAFSTRLIMANPGYRNSTFYNSADAAWLTAGQISMTTPVVRPGENAAFNFTWKAPTQSGLYQEGFMPAIDGYTLMPDFGMRFDTTVLP